MSLENHSIFCPVYISQSVDSLNTHHAFEILLVPCFKKFVIYALKVFLRKIYLFNSMTILRKILQYNK